MYTWRKGLFLPKWNEGPANLSQSFPFFSPKTWVVAPHNGVFSAGIPLPSLPNLWTRQRTDHVVKMWIYWPFTLQGTNISHQKSHLKMIFHFPTKYVNSLESKFLVFSQVTFSTFRKNVNSPSPKKITYCNFSTPNGQREAGNPPLGTSPSRLDPLSDFKLFSHFGFFQIKSQLVGGWTNPLETYYIVKWDHFHK